ncbi:crotamine-like [Python bivittatus]|uniref:Crotamine-like n=1 Tax=Python bivittatus TaxID=176946 RepID=A0A9F2RE37_PYTBI|nr:crotamine-like [Python bivittatus]
MKILYLLFASLLLAFLPEPGNASHRCQGKGGHCCLFKNCRYQNMGRVDCQPGWTCCRRGRWKIMPSPSTTLDVFKICPMT